MNALLQAIQAYLLAAVQANTLHAAQVYLGLTAIPDSIPMVSFPYVAIDDAGETGDPNVANSTINRKFSVLFEVGVAIADTDESLKQMLDLCDELRDLILLPANRQKDGVVWGINITPFIGSENAVPFRGRQITVEFWELEEMASDNY